MKLSCHLNSLLLLLSFGCSPELPTPEIRGCTEAKAPACLAELTETLRLQDGAVSPQSITSVAEGAGFDATIDARAGGLAAEPHQSFLYARFTDSGLQKVDINDADALSSMDWDIAFHRYLIRLNGGSSGPSCVGAAARGTDFDALTAAGDNYTVDAQFDADCAFLADSQAEDPGNERDYGLALSGPGPSYYDYVGCLSMTGNVFDIGLADGRAVKLQVTHFYNDEEQRSCDDTGANIGIGAATIQMRWAFLEVPQ